MSTVYRIRLIDPAYTAQLRGIAGTETDGVVAAGTYNATFTMHEFTISKTGYYKLWQDPLGGTNYAEWADWGKASGKYLIADNVLGNITVASTGLISGGVISVNVDDTLIDITAGEGRIIDTSGATPTSVFVKWAAKTAVNLTTTADPGDVVAIFLALDSNGDIVERVIEPTAEERRNTIDLGMAARNDSNQIVVVGNTPTNVIHSPNASMQDFFESFGGFSVSGNNIEVYNTDLRIQKSSGILFRNGANFRANSKNPHIVASAGQVPATFGYKLADGTDITLATTNIDPNNYDNGTSTPASVPTDKFTIQRISMFADGYIEILYGQQIFHLMSEAKAALPTLAFTVPVDSSSAILLAYLIIKQGTTNLHVETDAEFFRVQRYGEIGGIGFQNLNSSGMVYDPGLTDKENGSIDVGEGVANFYQTNNFTGDLKQYSLTGLTDQALTDLDTNYVVADYNNGNPIFRVTLDVLEINESDVVPVYTIYRSGNALYSLEWGTVGTGLVNKLHARFVKTNRFGHESGVALGEAGTRNITTTNGVLWVGGTRTILPATNSSTNVTEFWYHVSGVWTKSDVTQYNNTQYDDDTDLQSTGVGRYSVNWIYLGVNETLPHLYYALGSDNYTLSEAQASQPPGSLPEGIRTHTVLVGRIIVVRNSDTAVQVDSAFATQFVAAPVTNHNNLSSLQGGTTNEYYHLTSVELANLIAEIPSFQKLNLSNLPISASGLASGDVWNNSGVLNIVA